MQGVVIRGARRATLLALFVLLVSAFAASAASAAPLPDLSGTWAAVEVYSGYIDGTLFGRLPGAITARLQVEIVQSGSSLALRARYCTLGLGSPLPFVSAEIPPALLVSLEGAERAATLEATGNGVLFAQPWRSQASGARLAEADPLPLGPGDPRVFDEDRDGHPGVTLRASIADLANIDLYLVIRLAYRLSGTVLSPDRIEGEIEWEGEIALLGGSLPILPLVRKASADPDPRRSPFVLVRVAPDCGCPAVLAELDTLPRP